MSCSETNPKIGEFDLTIQMVNTKEPYNSNKCETIRNIDSKGKFISLDTTFTMTSQELYTLDTVLLTISRATLFNKYDVISFSNRYETCPKVILVYNGTLSIYYAPTFGEFDDPILNLFVVLGEIIANHKSQ